MIFSIIAFNIAISLCRRSNLSSFSRCVEVSLVGEFLPDYFFSSAELLEDSIFGLRLRFVFLEGDCGNESVNTLPFLSFFADLILICKENMNVG